MIISHIIGGLGNQMFQYANGRSFALNRSIPLKLDTQDFEGYELHNGFELGRLFDLQAPLANDCDVKRVLGWRSHPKIRPRLFRKQLEMFRGKKLVVDTQFSSWEQISEVPDNCYLMGNWQTEMYFKSVEDTIRSDFEFKSSLTGENKTVADQINSSVAVSLHVRRGDMAANPASLAFHGLCSLEYYKRAVEYLVARVPGLEFYIFSDDIPWVKDNLKLSQPCHYIDHNSGLDSYNDMRLMSLCQHHIIANSSFSWWGAWLNPNKDKVVVAPKVWFAAEFDSSDIIPLSWVKL